MSLRRRPKRADMVEDAVAVALGAARQAVKNHLIVRALRDGADFDRDTYLAATALEIGLLAAENDAGARGVAEHLARSKGRHGRALAPDDYRAADRRQLKKRRKVMLDVAERLREVAAEPETVGTLLDDARDLALAEISAATAAAHHPRRTSVGTAERQAALGELRAQLADLLDERTGY